MTNEQAKTQQKSEQEPTAEITFNGLTLDEYMSEFNQKNQLERQRIVNAISYELLTNLATKILSEKYDADNKILSDDDIIKMIFDMRLEQVIR